MTDARKAPWFAMDSAFYKTGLGKDILEEFGTVGQSVFVAFLAHCKTVTPEGQMEFGTDAEFLNVIGLAGVRLVDLAGNEWDMDTFWTWLGLRKQVSRRRRKHVTKVTSTNWGKWQQSFRRRTEAEQKRRSRDENTPDIDRTVDEQCADDAPPIDRPTDTGTSTGTEENPPPPSLALVNETPTEPDDEQRVFDAWLATLPEASRGRTRFTDDRRRKVRARLNEGIPVEELIEAAQGWQHDDWPERPNRNDLELLMRSGSNVEKFRDLWRAGPPARSARDGGGWTDEQRTGEVRATRVQL